MSGVKVGIIGGSGLGDKLASMGQAHRHEVQTPFGPPSDAIWETEIAGLPVYFLSRHGPGHLLNPSQVPYRANIFAMKSLGVTHLIASGAVGSLRDEMAPRDLAVADQIIDRTNQRVGTFFDKAAVHVEFSEPFCPVLRRMLLEAGKVLMAERPAEAPKPAGDPGSTPAAAVAAAMAPKDQKRQWLVHDRGCYVCMEGPAFSTRAESLMNRLLGGDLIGMTAMPEAKLAREAEISYALLALVTDYDCWRNKPAAPGEKAPDPESLLEEIIGNLGAATDNALVLIRRAVMLMSDLGEELLKAPAQQALKLGIWSNKSMIDPEEVSKLGPIWGRYFKE